MDEKTCRQYNLAWTNMPRNLLAQGSRVVTLAFYTGGIPLADGYISFGRSPCAESQRSEPPAANLEYIVAFRPAIQELRPTKVRSYTVMEPIVVSLLVVKSMYSTRPFAVAAHKVATYALRQWSAFSKT